MKLRDLLEAKTIIVNFSDLQQFDNFDARFWVDLKEYIVQYKKLGKDKSIEFVADNVKKIGEENYNSLKSISDKNKFVVPTFEIASNKTKLKTHSKAVGKIVVLMDLVQSKTKIRKAKLESELEKLQKLINKLED